MEPVQHLIILTFLASWIQAYYIRPEFPPGPHSVYDEDYLKFLEFKRYHDTLAHGTHNEKPKFGSTNRWGNVDQSNIESLEQSSLESNQFNLPPMHPFDYNSPYLPPASMSDSFLFNCNSLKPGFYADVDCRYFHLCHEPNLKLNPLNQLAITTYVCPEATFFNQKKLTCTRLEDFEMSCLNQIKLFAGRENSNLDETGKVKDDSQIESSIVNSGIDESAKNQTGELIDEQDRNLGEIVETTFSCDKLPPGYYADVLHGCRIFHICGKSSNILMNTFRCPYDLVFNQVTMSCTNEKELIVPCSDQEIFFIKLQSVVRRKSLNGSTSFKKTNTIGSNEINKPVISPSTVQQDSDEIIDENQSLNGSAPPNKETTKTGSNESKVFSDKVSEQESSITEMIDEIYTIQPIM